MYQIKEKINELTQEINELSRQIFISPNSSIYPSLIQEMIRVLKIDAIKTQFDIDISNEDLKIYSVEMFDCKNNQYLYKLFTYKNFKFENNFIPIKKLESDQLEFAIKDQINCEIEEVPNHPLVVFFKKWKSLYSKIY